MAIVQCRIKETPDSPDCSSPNNLELFEVDTILHPNLQSIDALLSLENREDISIPVYNAGTAEIKLSANTELAHIIPHKNQLQIFPLKYHSIDEANQHLDVNSTVSVDAIDSDRSLNEAEKNQAFLNYLKNGRYTKSMTKLLKDSLSHTEMQLQDTRPQTWPQIQTQINLQHLTSSQKHETLQMLHFHRKTFATHNLDLGYTNLIEAKINTDLSKPRITKYEPLPLNIQQNVHHILDQMHSFGLIRECQEPSNFVSNLLVTKSAEGEIKVLLDGRLLNNATELELAPQQPSIEHLARISSTKYISSLNLSNAHLQIPIAAEHQADTAFYSDAHGKRYCFLRSPKTRKNSAIILQKLINRIFSHSDIQDSILLHGKELLVASNTSFSDHLQTLGRALVLLDQANLKINAAKLAIAKQQVEFLGIVWHKGSLNIPAARISAFKNIPYPSTPKKLKAILDAISVYRNFIPRFDEHTNFLQELSSLHHKQFKWSSEHQQRFNALINVIQNHTSLNSPDPSKPFYIQSDASDVAGAGRVFQKDHQGHELLLACVSRTFTTSERSYSIFKKEVLALLYTLKALDFYLRSANKVIILIDAKQ
jgi:hypothetical protein